MVNTQCPTCGASKPDLSRLSVQELRECLARLRRGERAFPREPEPVRTFTREEIDAWN